MTREAPQAIRPWAEISGDVPARRRLPSRRGPSSPRALEPEQHWWAGTPKAYLVNGVRVEFHYIAALAGAVGRTPATIRLWERQGVIPVAPYFKRISDGTLRPFRRLYPRAWIEAAERIANEEGIISHRPQAWATSEFSIRLGEAWRELALWADSALSTTPQRSLRPRPGEQSGTRQSE